MTDARLAPEGTPVKVHASPVLGPATAVARRDRTHSMPEASGPPLSPGVLNDT